MNSDNAGWVSKFVLSHTFVCTDMIVQIDCRYVQLALQIVIVFVIDMILDCHVWVRPYVSMANFQLKLMLIDEINQYTNFWQWLCMWYTTYSLSTYTCPCFSSRVLFHIEYSGRWISIKFTWSFCYLPLFRVQVTVTDSGRSWFVYNSKQIIPIFHSLCCTAGRSYSIHCVTQRVENTDMQICMKSLSPLFLLFSLKQG